jgi:hypothetical protein
MSWIKGYLAQLPPWGDRLTALLLVTPGCVLAVLFWRVPVSNPISVEALLVDRILEIATTTLPLTVMIIIFGTWRFARWAAFLAALVCAVLGVATALAGLRPPVDAWPTVLAILAAVSGLTLAFHGRIPQTHLRWPAVSLVGLLSLLPLIQFWHASSFVPSQLSASVGAEAALSGTQLDDGGAQGTVELEIRNNSDVGALVLASELVLCYRDGPAAFLRQESLYTDPTCITESIFDVLSTLDAKSSWKIRHGFTHPALSTGPVKSVQAIVLLWYARQDRLRIDNSSVEEIDPGPPCKGPLVTYAVLEESRYKGVVQRDRRLNYYYGSADKVSVQNGSGDAYFALTTEGEPPCSDGAYDYGLPRPSDYGIADYVGMTSLRLNHEDWLAKPSK